MSISNDRILFSAAFLSFCVALFFAHRDAQQFGDQLASCRANLDIWGDALASCRADVDFAAGECVATCLRCDESWVDCDEHAAFDLQDCVRESYGGPLEPDTWDNCLDSTINVHCSWRVPELEPQGSR